MPSSSLHSRLSPTARLFADADDLVGRMSGASASMDAGAVDRLLRDGLASLGLADLLLDDDEDDGKKQHNNNKSDSSSPQSIASAAAASGTLVPSNYDHPRPLLGLGLGLAEQEQKQQPRPNHRDVLAQIGAWSDAVACTSTCYEDADDDDDFILTSVGITAASSNPKSATGTDYALAATSTSSASSNIQNERILEQILLASAGCNSTLMSGGAGTSSAAGTASATSSAWKEEEKDDANDNDNDNDNGDNVAITDITSLFGRRASSSTDDTCSGSLLDDESIFFLPPDVLGLGTTNGSSSRPASATSTGTTCTASTSLPSTYADAARTPAKSNANTPSGSGDTCTGKSPTGVANFPTAGSSPTCTPMARLDRHYQKILADLREQMRPLEEAPLLEFGMAWNRLLETVLTSIYPLAAGVQDPAWTLGMAGHGQGRDDDVSPDPMRHYQPLLLECARVWRRSLREAIERNREETEGQGVDEDWRRSLREAIERNREETEGQGVDEEGRSRRYSNTLLRREDRRRLVRQAARIVRRYLHLHRVFPSTDADAGSKVHPWDDFSDSSLVDSSHFLDFVYEQILLPAYRMGWVDLISENIEDSSLYVQGGGGQTKNEDSKDISSVANLRPSSNLLGPVIGAIHTVIARKGRDGEIQGVNSGKASAGSNDGPIISDWDSILYNLGFSIRSLLGAKLNSLSRITVVSPSDREEDMMPSHRPGHPIENKTGYTISEADALLQDCVMLWRELAISRKKNYKALLVTDRQIRSSVSAELAEYALRITCDFQRIHGISIRNLCFYDKVPTVHETVKMMDFVYESFLLPSFQFGIQTLPSHLVEIKGDRFSFASLVTGGITHLKSVLYGSSGASREANRFDGKLFMIGIGKFAHMLRIELSQLEAYGKKEIASGEADHKLRNCLVTWKEASREVWSSRWTALPHQLIELNQREAELIQLADALVQQYQRLHHMNAEGIDFFLSSIRETCLILDFIYDHFVSHGLALGIKFVRNDSLCGKSGHGTTSMMTGRSHMKHGIPKGSYDFLDLVVNGIENLRDRGEVETAIHYLDKFSLFGKGECKGYLETELLLHATKQS